jgi:hypothetical protein
MKSITDKSGLSSQAAQSRYLTVCRDAALADQLHRFPDAEINVRVISHQDNLGKNFENAIPGRVEIH